MRIAGREVQFTNPDKVFFPVAGYTKGDLLDYYLAVADGAVRAVLDRPTALKRFVQGADCATLSECLRESVNQAVNREGYRSGLGTAAYSTSPRSSNQIVIVVSETPSFAAVVASRGSKYTHTEFSHSMKVTGARK
jgi:DNA primase